MNHCCVPTWKLEQLSDSESVVGLYQVGYPLRDMLRESPMKKCEVCGALILFGPVRSGKHAYCSYECRDSGDFAQETRLVDDDSADAVALKINIGNCSKCGGPGPVDVQFSHTVWSAFFVTSYKSTPEVCCGKCGRMSKLKAILFSFGLGWWGFPFGLIITPVQIGRNLVGMFWGPVQGAPSPDLSPFAKVMLADAMKRGESSSSTEA